MRKLNRGMMALAAMSVFVVAHDRAEAQLLDPPENVTCDVVDDVIEVAWDPVDGADKYSVSVLAGYDLADDGEIDEVLEFDFGTSDRTDGGDISDPSLDIPLDDLVIGVDTMGDGELDTFFDPESPVVIRVKGLNPGQGRGRQNHPFSDPCILDLP